MRYERSMCNRAEPRMLQRLNWPFFTGLLIALGITAAFGYGLYVAGHRFLEKLAGLLP
jgi:hypothetical protein